MLILNYPQGDRDMHGEKKTILLVDDEAAITIALEEFLFALGYRVLTSVSSKKAMQLGATAERLDLLLTDVVMPEANGHQLANMLRHIHPHLKVIYMSAYMRPAIEEIDLRNKEAIFLQKPFTFRKLTRTLRELLGEGLEDGKGSRGKRGKDTVPTPSGLR